jgi:catechol 2,3-dioxygenase-like lactoylglutathione lyase family enzyme
MANKTPSKQLTKAEVEALMGATAAKISQKTHSADMAEHLIQFVRILENAPVQQQLNCCQATSLAYALSALGFPTTMDDIFWMEEIPVEGAVGDGMTLAETFDLATRYIRRARLPVFVECHHFDALAGLTPEDLWAACLADTLAGPDEVLAFNFHSGIAHGWAEGGGGHFSVLLGATGSVEASEPGDVVMADVHPLKYGAYWSAPVAQMFGAMADKDSCGRARGLLRFGLTSKPLARPTRAMQNAPALIDWAWPPPGHDGFLLQRFITCHLAVETANIPRNVAFYNNVLGWPLYKTIDRAHAGASATTYGSSWASYGAFASSVVFHEARVPIGAQGQGPWASAHDCPAPLRKRGQGGSVGSISFKEIPAGFLGCILEPGFFHKQMARIAEKAASVTWLDVTDVRERFGGGEIDRAVCFKDPDGYPLIFFVATRRGEAYKARFPAVPFVYSAQFRVSPDYRTDVSLIPRKITKDMLAQLMSDQLDATKAFTGTSPAASCSSRRSGAAVSASSSSGRGTSSASSPTRSTCRPRYDRTGRVTPGTTWEATRGLSRFLTSAPTRRTRISPRAGRRSTTPWPPTTCPKTMCGAWRAPGVRRRSTTSTATTRCSPRTPTAAWPCS